MTSKKRTNKRNKLACLPKPNSTPYNWTWTEFELDSTLHYPSDTAKLTRGRRETWHTLYTYLDPANPNLGVCTVHRCLQNSPAYVRFRQRLRRDCPTISDHEVIYEYALAKRLLDRKLWKSAFC